MNIDRVFVSVNAQDFDGLSDWYCKLLNRNWDREPMPSCHEWDIAGCVHFQVLDNPKLSGNATVTLHISGLRAEIERLRNLGIDVPAPQKIDGFDGLYYAGFSDPEGNQVGLLEGS